MQQTSTSMIGYKVIGSDGELGKTVDFYFDDATWTVRYLVLETGSWLPGRKSLIAISAIGKISWAAHMVHVNLAREQVRSCPEAQPEISPNRHFEIALHRYYDWNSYWGGGFYILPGYGMDMISPVADTELEEEQEKIRKLDPHLRSMQEIIGYLTHATDGDIGHVADLVLDEEKWAIRYLVIDTGNWLPGRKVIISPQWISEIDWNQSKLFVDVTRNEVRKSPSYNPSELITLEYEKKLLQHLKKPEYAAWVTFKFHAPKGANIHVAGTFNNWNPEMIRLEDDGKGIYSATVLIPAGKIEYKFIVDGRWCNSPECKDLTPNAFGSMNSVMVVGHGHEGHMHTFSRMPVSHEQLTWRTP